MGIKYQIKHKALINDYENGGLRFVDVFSKIVSLQWPWIRGLYNKPFFPWKKITLYPINSSTRYKLKSNIKILRLNHTLKRFLEIPI